MLAAMAASASLKERRAPLAAARSRKSWVAGNVCAAAAVSAGSSGGLAERIQSVDVFAFDLQRLAAGRQDVDLRCFDEDA